VRGALADHGRPGWTLGGVVLECWSVRRAAAGVDAFDSRSGL